MKLRGKTKNDENYKEKSFKIKKTCIFFFTCYLKIILKKEYYFYDRSNIEENM